MYDYDPLSPDQIKKAFCKILRDASRRHRMADVFRDFCEMFALELSAAVDLRTKASRLERFAFVKSKYEPQELALFPRMYACVIDGMSCGLSDFMGSLFMSLELGDSFKGQFFTPYEVSRMMAAMTLDNVGQVIEANGFVTLSEPACGAGGMIVACADEIQSLGFNYQKTMHATMVDIDLTAVHMAYIQCSLLAIPAIIVHGNALTVQEWDHWYTFGHINGRWGGKLRNHQDTLRAAFAMEATPVIKQPVAQPARRAVIRPLDQLDLFA